MAKYIMQEMPDLQGKGKRIKFPKMLINYKYPHKSIVKEIADRTSFTQGDIEGVLTALTETIAYRMALGGSVKIDGLGVFKAKLGLRDGAEREEEGSSKRNAMSIEVTDVNYKADKKLVHSINQSCRLEREKARQYTDHKAGKLDRLEMLKTYLQEHHLIRVWEYKRLTGLSASSAGKELRAFAAEGLINPRGRGAHLLYLASTEPGTP